MKIYNECDEIKLNNTAVTLGKFNGVHKGHQELIAELKKAEIEKGLTSVLFSFDTTPHQSQVSLTTRRERAILCEKFGIDDLVMYPVNEITMSMTAEEFIKEVLVKKLDAKVIVTGEDFHFGKNRVGNVQLLKKYSKECGYTLITLPSMMYESEKISSTKIKLCITQGKLDDANNMLGYRYFIAGNIVKGRQIGRTMGIKTINIKADFEKLLLPNGVYATGTLIHGKEYTSITNIGICPTVSSDNNVVIETNLFDFEEEVYSEEAVVYFKKFIRPEVKFENTEMLKSQIMQDISIAKSL